MSGRQYAVLEANGKVNVIGEKFAPPTLPNPWTNLDAASNISLCLLQGVDVQHLTNINSAAAALHMREKRVFECFFHAYARSQW